jgi:hypothetical protein
MSKKDNSLSAAVKHWLDFPINLHLLCWNAVVGFCEEHWSGNGAIFP